MTLSKDLRKRILVLDGALGTELRKLKFTKEDFTRGFLESHPYDLSGYYELLNVTMPAVIKSILKDYVTAGADIISTNTFQSTEVGMFRVNLQGFIYYINHAAAKLARQVADESERKVYVAGVIGPTEKIVKDTNYTYAKESAYVSAYEMESSYRTQISALLSGGVDMLLIETVINLDSAEAALRAIEKEFKSLRKTVPIMLTVVINPSTGQVLQKGTLQQLKTLAKRYKVKVLGVNCSFNEYVPLALSELACEGVYTSFHPSTSGEYNVKALSDIELLVESNMLNIVGGCCGTDRHFIKSVKDIVTEKKPRHAPSR